MYLINEKIIGNIGFVYHRTHSLSAVQGIAKDGFRPGGGDYYGKGLYATYELSSQLSKRMSTYGQYVLKCYVSNLSSYLIWDEDIAKKVLGPKDFSVRSQLVKFGFGSERSEEQYGENLRAAMIDLQRIIRQHLSRNNQVIPPKELGFMNKTYKHNVWYANSGFKILFDKVADDGTIYLKQILDRSPMPVDYKPTEAVPYSFLSFHPRTKTDIDALMERLNGARGNTSAKAKMFYEMFPSIQNASKINGMIFTGNNDGNVLVSYDTSTIKPVAYKDLKIGKGGREEKDFDAYMATRSDTLYKNPYLKPIYTKLFKDVGINISEHLTESPELVSALNSKNDVGTYFSLKDIDAMVYRVFKDTIFDLSPRSFIEIEDMKDEDNIFWASFSEKMNLLRKYDIRHISLSSAIFSLFCYPSANVVFTTKLINSLNLFSLDLMERISAMLEKKKLTKTSKADSEWTLLRGF